jgi:tripartite-type tricarboxylate transporter receptor subunit TctC
MNPFLRNLGRGVGALAVGFAAAAFAAEPFPTRPVRIVVPAAPGGSLDLTTRLVAQKMGEKLGQTVIVENRPGGDTLIGVRAVKDAPADGYTLLSSANGLTLLPQMKLAPGYDPVKDFAGIGFMTRSPLILEVGADQPDRTLAEFVARAKANPGKLSYGHAGVGTPPHIAAAGFLHAAGLDVLSVPYKGNGAALPDVIGNRLQMIVDGYISSSSFIASGKLKPLGVSSSTRISPLPNVPTFKEQGIDYTYTLWLGLLVRSGTPKEVVQKLSEALRYATSSKELDERFRAEGSDPSFVTSAAFDSYIAQETGQMVKLASDLKLPKE